MLKGRYSIYSYVCVYVLYLCHQHFHSVLHIPSSLCCALFFLRCTPDRIIYVNSLCMHPLPLSCMSLPYPQEKECSPFFENPNSPYLSYSFTFKHICTTHIHIHTLHTFSAYKLFNSHFFLLFIRFLSLLFSFLFFASVLICILFRVYVHLALVRYGCVWFIPITQCTSDPVWL